MSDLHSSRAASHEVVPDFARKLQAGKPILFRPRGNSMLPSVADGTVVMVDPVSEMPKLFDVVLALLDGHVVLHRVIHVDGSFLWLRGDAHRHTEGPLPLERIIGVARLDKPRGLRALSLSLHRYLFLAFHLGHPSC
jgi:Peptidase S24-like